MNWCIEMEKMVFQIKEILFFSKMISNYKNLCYNFYNGDC